MMPRRGLIIIAVYLGCLGLVGALYAAGVSAVWSAFILGLAYGWLLGLRDEIA